MERLRFEDLRCFGVDVLNYNLRSNLLELISLGNTIMGVWRRDWVLERLPSENIWGQGERDFPTGVQMVLSSLGLQERPKYPFTVSGAFGLCWNFLEKTYSLKKVG